MVLAVAEVKAVVWVALALKMNLKLVPDGVLAGAGKLMVAFAPLAGTR
jgi:hypothetical protein